MIPFQDRNIFNQSVPIWKLNKYTKLFRKNNLIEKVALLTLITLSRPAIEFYKIFCRNLQTQTNKSSMLNHA